VPNFCNYALNCGEMQRVEEAKRAGKIDEAHVVAAMKNGTGRLEVRGRIEAEKLHPRVAEKPVRRGTFGDFWTLEPFDLGGQGPAVLKRAKEEHPMITSTTVLIEDNKLDEMLRLFTVHGIQYGDVTRVLDPHKSYELLKLSPSVGGLARGVLAEDPLAARSLQRVNLFRCSPASWTRPAHSRNAIIAPL
jgi:hypothetical protein